MYAKIFSGAIVAVLAVAGVAATTGANEGGCALTEARPCYDKVKKRGTSILKKNGPNSFSACLENSAPNDHGEANITTTLCQEEEFSYSYCFEGKSRIYMRYFDGTCTPVPEPDPDPVPGPDPEPDPDPDPVSFRVVLPNGGETLPFGSYFPIRWEGGEPAWPIKLSIINSDLTKTRRGLAWELTNDGIEDWIVDLPYGDYVMYAHGCYSDDCAETDWDYGDSYFSVVEGAPLGRIDSIYETNKSVVILSPSGGESWATGSTHEIIWSGASNDSTIYLSLIDDVANVVHSVIVSSTENDGKYLWTVPEDLTPGLYKIHIRCNECDRSIGSGWYAYSFEPFTVVTNP